MPPEIAVYVITINFGNKIMTPLSFCFARCGILLLLKPGAVLRSFSSDSNEPDMCLRMLFNILSQLRFQVLCVEYLDTPHQDFI